MRDYVYVNTSPCIPSLVTRVFSSPKTTSLPKGTVLWIVKACLSLLTYQTEVLILSAADWLIRCCLQEKPGHSSPQASHAWRTEESLLPLWRPRQEWCRQKKKKTKNTHTWYRQLAMATETLVRPDHEDSSSGRGLSHDKREFWKVTRQQQRLSNSCLLLL